MVRQGRPAALGKLCSQAVYLIPRAAIDDSRLVAVVLQEGQHLAQAARARLHGKLQIAPVEAGHEHVGIGEPQAFLDVPLHSRRRSSRQRDADRVPVAAAHVQQLAVFRAKIVAPLGDAMRLVDHQAGQPAVVQQTQRFRSQQRLGGRVQQAELPVPRLLHGCCVVAVIQRAVEERRRHAQRAQLVHLVLHQRDQR